MQLRRLTPDDVLSASRLTAVAFGGGPREGRIRRYLALEPEGWFTVDEAGALLAVGGVVRFGPLAWLGLMAVEPNRQREGLGRTIAEAAIGWARSQGCATVLLIATAAGIPLYRRLGFVHDGESSELAGAPEAPRPASGPCVVRPWTTEDIEAVARFDAPAFGADRGRLLATYVREFPASAWVARDVLGRVRGFLVLQGETLGPWSATDETAAGQLLDVGLAGVRGPLRAGIADVLGQRLLEARGLKRTRSLPRMRLGPAVGRAASPQLLAHASYAVGCVTPGFLHIAAPPANAQRRRSAGSRSGGTKRGASRVSRSQRAMKPAQGDEDMLPSMSRLFSAALLLGASGALADSPLPAVDVPAKEIVTRVAAETPKADDQLRTLTREVESLQSDVRQLRAKEAERAVHEAELSGPNDHPMWP